MSIVCDKLKENGYSGHALEVYLIRLLYCMFSDDSGIFERGSFYSYIKEAKEDGTDLSRRLAELFEVLDMNEEKRAENKLLPESMKSDFPYINGKLFREKLTFAYFDGEMRTIILDCCKMDWSKISPAIFGAMFQAVIDPQKRRELGAHYTSEENILKVIKPLFLDDLRTEFENIKYDKRKLKDFHAKISNLKFLDPACGCGNFLIVAYRELRLLELDVLSMLIEDNEQISIDVVNTYCRVNVDQFYGIEIEDFPCQIAQVGMWLIDHLMNQRVAAHFGLYYARLPLKVSATIVKGNALRLDWTSIVPKEKLNYIMGNPPFVGYHLRNQTQQEDMDLVFGKKFKRYGVLDYVTAWYKKAAEYMKNTKIEAAFVSTNSISQGEQPAILWEPLMKENNAEINFAYKTFKWGNEAKGKKAAVHCVIIGFSDCKNGKPKKIFYSDKSKNAKEINPYLTDAPNITVTSRSQPICDAPAMAIGNRPTDNGNLLLNEKERNEIVKENKLIKKYIKPFMGGNEFINGEKRWCLWFVNANPTELRKCKAIKGRIERVREFRLKSKSKSTNKCANTPTLFQGIRQPQSKYLFIPQLSSEKRIYIPIGFIDKSIIPSDPNLIVEGATLYHFGILTSSIHMAWVRAVAGRSGMSYRYSKDIVYNNFIWPKPTPQQKENIEKAAQEVLDARKLYPDSTLADLYDPNTMPPELVKAHEKLDKAVKAAYGDKGFETEEEIVASLMKLYKEAIDKENKQDNSNINLNIVKNISPYLADAPDVTIKARKHPISNVPKMLAGNKPVDYNTLKIEPSEYKVFLNKEPTSLRYIKRLVGAEEFINNKKRYCLWLVDCPPNELRKMPMVYERVKLCKEKRLESKSIDARKLANIPTQFRETMNPKNYLLIPAVSSEKRNYIPMGFLNENYIPVMGTLFIKNATLYEFGILTSCVHMAWMRAIAGRLGLSYRYSNSLVYNNFIWPKPTPQQKENIEKAAQEVLDARKLYPGSTLADLYDPNAMPPELVKAHEKLDKAVKAAYGNNGFETEEEIVASLMKLYKEAIDKENNKI